MQNPIEIYRKQRLDKCKNALENNNFDAYIAEDPFEANKIIIKEIIPKIKVKSDTWVEFMTLHSTDD